MDIGTAIVLGLAIIGIAAVVCVWLLVNGLG